jgi:hypothetical protein
MKCLRATFVAAALSLCLSQGVLAQTCAWSPAGRVGGPCRSVALDGNHVLYPTGRALNVVDAAVPRAMRLVSSLEMPAVISDVAFVDGIAYVAAAGLHVVDVRDPSRPYIIRSFLEIDGVVIGGGRVVVQRDRLCLVGAAERPYSLMVFDISSPDSPQMAGVFDMPTDYLTFAEAFNDHLLVGGLDVLLVLDTGEPGNIQLVASYNLGGWASACVAVPPLVYFSTYNRLSTLDLSNPASPQLVRIDSFERFSSLVLDEARSGLLGVTSQVLVALNVSDPNDHIVRGFIGEVGSYNGQVALRGDLAFVADGIGLFAVNVRHPGQMRVVGKLPSVQEAYDIGIVGHTAYFTTRQLIALDFSNPQQPRLTGHDDVDPYSPIAVGGNRVCVRGNGQLRIYDGGDPELPLLGAINTPSGQLAIQGDTVLVAGESLSIVDIADPAAPRIRAEMPLPHRARAIDVRGNLAAIGHSAGDGPGHLTLVDVGDASNPVVLSTTEYSRGILSLEFGEGSDLYAVLAYDDPRQIDISNPSAPGYARSIPGIYYAYSIISDGGRLWVAGSSGARLYARGSGGNFAPLRQFERQNSYVLAVSPGRAIVSTPNGLSIYNTLLADFNGDGTVNTVDLATLLASFESSAPFESGDADCNGRVDTADLALLLAEFGM